MAGLSAPHRPLTERVDALAEAVRLADDVLPEDVTLAAAELVARAGDRLRLPDHTVVAFAGPTGSGKSSLLNALAGRPVAEVAATRPTTSEALALVRADGAAPLLDWLGVRRRHDLGSGAGLVVLDLPDHDSVVIDHRLEAERLVGLVDLLVWVVDPQKYADAAVHERYLRGLAAHRDVLLVVLNQVDRLTAEERRACHRDLERLLADDGLAGVEVLDISARTGEGVAALETALAEAARRRQASRDRLAADLTVLGGRVVEACGSAARGGTGPVAPLVDALAETAGVPVVVDAVRAAHLRRAGRATGWPPLRWLSRVRPDPLRRLHLGPGEAGHTSLPTPGAAQLARARSAVRSYVDAATTGIPQAWVLEARRRADPPSDELAAALDAAVAATPLPAGRPIWWRVVGGLQWMLLLAAMAGLAWLAILAGAAALRLALPDPPAWGSVPVPTAALLGGLLLGAVLALLARALAGVGARRQARVVEARLHRAIAGVAERLVTAPVTDVLDRLVRARSAAQVAMAGRRRRR